MAPVQGEPEQPLYQQLPAEQLNDLPETSPRVVGICGQPRSGKDVVADYLVANYSGVRRMAFSDAIMPEVNEYLAAEGLEHTITSANKSEPAYRKLLQEWGMGRAQGDSDYWTRKTLESAAAAQAEGARLVIVTGLRLQQDLDSVRSISGEIWEVDRPGNDYQAEHAVEDQLSEAFKERRIGNDVEGDLKPFEDNVLAALRQPLS